MSTDHPVPLHAAWVALSHMCRLCEDVLLLASHHLSSQLSDLSSSWLLQHGLCQCLMLLCRAELAPAENELVQAAVQSKRDEMDCQIDQLLWSQSESMRNFWEVRPVSGETPSCPGTEV